MRIPEISYIVSLFNKSSLLPVCLWSLKAQSHGDFEVIVTDNTEDDVVAKSHQRFIAGLKDDRFRYLRTSGKIKVSDCYWSAEYGMKQARGKWLCFPCEDCYYPPEWTRRMLVAAMVNQWDLALCENAIAGPETHGAHDYLLLRLGSESFPGYKPSFIVLKEKFPEWLNKPVIGACSGVDRTTLRTLLGQVRWGAVRDLFYFHN